MGQCAQSAVGRGVGISTNYRHPGQRSALLRPHNMDDSLAYIVDIELDDVEAVLGSAEDVSEAAVIFNPGRNALEAFVSGPSPTSQSVLLAHCALYLPAHALPDKVRFLDCLDRTSTGKVDRQALLQRLNTPETPSPRYLDA